MEKFRFFGLLAIVLLAFTLVVSCGSPTDPSVVEPGPGPGEDGAAYSVPKGSAPGYSPAPPPPPKTESTLITFSVAKDTEATTAALTITFSKIVVGLLKDDVTITNGSGEAVKSGTAIPSSTNGTAWTVPLDPAKTKTGIVNISVKKDGVVETAQPVGVVLTSAPGVVITSILPTPNDATPIAYHKANTTSIAILFAGAVPAGFDPARHITTNPLTTAWGGTADVKLGTPTATAGLTPPAVGWDIPVTVTKQGPVEVYVDYAGVSPIKTEVKFTKVDPIDFSIKAEATGTSKTTNKLTFTFTSDPAALGASNATALAGTALKVATPVGAGSIDDTIIQAAVTGPTVDGSPVTQWKVDPDDPKVYTLELLPADLPKLKAGSVYLYFDVAGIVTAGTPDPVLHRRSVTLEREELATFTASTIETLGITTAIKLTFNRPITPPATFNQTTFTLTDLDSGTGPKATKAALKAQNVVRLSDTEYRVDLQNTLVKAGNGLTLAFANDAAAGSDIDPKAKGTFNVAYDPVKFTIELPVGQADFKTSTIAAAAGTATVTVDIKFSREMLADADTFMTVLVAGDFEVAKSATTGGILGTLAVSGTTVPKWVDKDRLQVVITGIAGNGVAAASPSTGAGKGKIKIGLAASPTTVATTYFISPNPYMAEVEIDVVVAIP